MTTTTIEEVDRLHDLGLYAAGDPPIPPDFTTFADADPPPCEICGCTDLNACFDAEAGEPCHWVAQDLCSRCARNLGE